MATSLSFGKKRPVSELGWMTRLKPTTLAALMADLEGSGFIASEAYQMLINIVGKEEADRMIDKEDEIS